MDGTLSQGHITMRIFFGFAFSFSIILSASANVINIGGVSMPLWDSRPTTPALGVRNDAGVTKYLPVHTCLTSGRPAVRFDNGVNYSLLNYNWTLLHSISAVNTCQSFTLTPGYYLIQYLGGTGGKGGDGLTAGTAGIGAVAGQQELCITETTTMHTFRGGNGNAGANGNRSGNSIAAGSGGASGAPSMVVVGTNVLISEGGGGGRGGNVRDHNNNTRNCGMGGGGNAGANSNGGAAGDNYAWSTNFYMCGAGGGGSPSGAGAAQSGSSSYGGGASAAGTLASGGSGGNAWRMLDSWSGGNGGTTVTWNCGGQALRSFGGGGAGALTTNAVGAHHLPGVAGASGTTGASSGYIYIYKLD